MSLKFHNMVYTQSTECVFIGQVFQYTLVAKPALQDNPICLDAPLYVLMPPYFWITPVCLDVPICLDTALNVWAPLCLDAP